MKAGAKWKEGADTCVFKPAVKCEGESDVRSGISRIQPNEIAADERQVEEVLKARFPRLIEDGSITVSSHVCVPEFTDDDLKSMGDVQFMERNNSSRACARVTKDTPNLVNFITPEVNGVPYAESPLQRESRETKYKAIRNILNAVVQLVPDMGPWVIHTDAHIRNILIKTDGTSTLIDWGRSIVIQNPGNDAEITQAVNEWTRNPYARINPSYPEYISNSLHSMKRPGGLGWDKSKSAPASQQRDTLRQWTFSVILGQVLGGYWFGDDIVSQAGMTSFLKMLDETYLPKTGGVYWPAKYHRGLTRRQNLQRKRSATRRTKMSWKNPKAYAPFKSDKGVKTRRSSYSSRFHKKYPEAKTVSEIAKATGISKSILDQVYNRGMAAWRTGHRPGASQHAWGMARVHSFVLKGKTWRTADADLARKV
jgi:hypothetical protein